MKLSLKSSMKSSLLVFALLSFGAPALAQTVEPVGRTQKDAEGRLWQQWPGIYADATFSGDILTLKGDGVNRYKVYVDGQEKPILGKADTAVTLSNLGKGAHRLRLEKISESQDKAAVFATAEAANLQPAPPRPRQIEFIGDSYTVGYGNTSTKRECTTEDVWATTDTSQAFGPLTAKLYDADYQINAFSGRGIVRNYNGFQGDTLPALYAHTLFDGKSPYDGNGWKPRIIVIGLGTNDFSTALNPGETWKSRDALQADYRNTYVAFVKQLRAKNSQAHFILMASDQAGGEIRNQVAQVTKTLKDGGETRLDAIYFDGLDFGGCHFHPSLADDRKLSGLLKDWIDAHPKVWQGQ